jgi:hypothetical protein
MKRLRRERAKGKRALSEQEDKALRAAKFEELVAWNRARYGHLFTTSWIYQDDLCPCCGKRPVETSAAPLVSLNTFLYNEQAVLIGYRLCRVCAVDLIEASRKRKALLHQQIERCLMAAYQRHRAETALPRGAESPG